MKKIKFKAAAALLAIASFSACSKNAEKSAVSSVAENQAMTAMMLENGANPDEMVMNGIAAGPIVESEGGEFRRGTHFVFSESNDLGTNRILSYGIGGNGLLHLTATTSSGGAGTGMGLGSQGALALDKDHDRLFAVNAGSNSVSSFLLRPDGSLSLEHTRWSGGETPVGVAVYDRLLYVLNTGSDAIHGFRIGEDGRLTDIDGSTQALSGKGVVAPQISFSPDGKWVIVTEKATNNISSFKVKADGSVWPDAITPSTGMTPFGFAFARDGFMIVSNAAGGAAAAGSATSYANAAKGKPLAINGAVANYQGAPCWVAASKYGRFAFVSNTGSNSISSYYISEEGKLFLVHQVAGATDNKPIDLVVAADNYHVYVLNGGSATIGAFHRTPLGGLEPIGKVTGLPAGTTGLVTY